LWKGNEMKTEAELQENYSEALSHYEMTNAAHGLAELSLRAAKDELGELIALKKFGIRRGDVVTYTHKEGMNEKIITRRITASRFSGNLKGDLYLYGRVVTANGAVGASDYIDLSLTDYYKVIKSGPMNEKEGE
jgi:hypothetical protein